MGYTPVRKTYELAFEDYPGLEVMCRPTPLGKLMEVSDMKVDLNASDEDKMKVFNIFIDCVASWNIQHPELDKPDTRTCERCGLNVGDPLPCTLTGMLCLDLDFLMVVIFGWLGAISRVSVPKGMSFNSGGTNVAIENMMNQLAQQQSPPILPMPN